MSAYTEAFYDHQKEGSLRSARAVVPLIMEMVSPKSVIDIGCGLGTWLSVYQQHGVESITGIDGPYINPHDLLIDDSHFLARDLTKPFGLERRFDLVQCLEVAEHLEQEHAGRFVENLTELGDIIVFSAAVPYQLGTHHVNEQFIDYWIALFSQHGYLAVDAMRPAIWDNTDIEVCYRQNILFFVREEIISSFPGLDSIASQTNPRRLSMIHPELYAPRIRRLLGTLQDIGAQAHKNGNLQLAQTIYQSVLDFDPGAGNVWNALGQLAAQAGDFKHAVSHMTRAINLSPANVSCLYNLGQIYAAMGEHDKARSLYNQALALEPGYELAHQGLANLPQ